MKKIFIVILFLLVMLSTTFIPYQTGVEAEHYMANADKMLPSWLNLKPLDHRYERGWWKSYAQSHFETHQPWIPQITLVHHIDHGFLPIRPAKIETFSPSEDNTDLFRTQTFIQLNGQSVTQITVPPRKLSLGDKEIEWKAWNGEATMQKNLKTLDAQFHIPEIHYLSHIFQVHGHQLHFYTHTQQQSEKKAIKGNARLELKEVEWVSQQLRLKGIDLKVDDMSIEDTNFLSAHVSLMINIVQRGQEDYEQGQCEMELKHINLPILKKMSEAWLTYSPEKHLETWASLFFYLSSLAKDVQELKLTHLSLQTRAGTLQGQGIIKITDRGGAQNLFSLLNGLEAEIKLSVPKNLLMMALSDNLTTPNEAVRTEQFLNTWLNQGMLIKTQEEMYHTRLQLKEGNLQVNGKTFSFAALWQSK